MDKAKQQIRRNAKAVMLAKSSTKKKKKSDKKRIFKMSTMHN